MSRRRTSGGGNRVLATYPTIVMIAAVVGALLGRPSNTGLTDAAVPTPSQVTVVPRDLVAVPPAVLMEPPGDRIPRLAIMGIHGGSWLGPNPGLVAAMERRVERWHRQGWAIMVVEYQAGAAGLEDLLADYDSLRQRYRETPICLYGYSAGAHMALMMASRRPDVRCIISEAGPTDLAGNPRAAAAFGEANLEAWSPIRFAGRIHASVLQVAAANDPWVPVSQPQSLATRLRSGTLRILEPGSAPFIHSNVDADQLDSVYGEELSFLARFED